MITGFNKKELRLFEKYRKQWNLHTDDNCNVIEFSHVLGCDYHLPHKSLMDKNYDLMFKYSIYKVFKKNN